jgi:predicted RNA-binding Zn ribbon-like protein
MGYNLYGLSHLSSAIYRLDCAPVSLTEISVATSPKESDRFEWVGGALPLDFTNTVTWLEEGTTSERLEAYSDLVAWAVRARVLSPRDAEALLGAAHRRPQKATRALERAHEVRSILHALFSDIAQAREPNRAHLAAFNGALAETLAKQRVASAGESFNWTWGAGADLASPVLAPVVWSAAELLTSERLTHVRRCANVRCGWLFVDTSRKHNRRWCDMRVCGSRAKARRHYERTRARNRGSRRREREER